MDLFFAIMGTISSTVGLYFSFKSPTSKDGIVWNVATIFWVLAYLTKGS